MKEIQNSKKYDLEERTFKFSKDVRNFVKGLTKTVEIIGDVKQLLAASGSVGANYIEANEALSKKDFIMRIKICRKEAKESHYWLRLLEENASNGSRKQWEELHRESSELTKIFGAILRKCE